MFCGMKVLHIKNKYPLNINEGLSVKYRYCFKFVVLLVKDLQTTECNFANTMNTLSLVGIHDESISSVSHSFFHAIFHYFINSFIFSSNHSLFY